MAGMWRKIDFWLRLLGIAAVLLCCLLAVVPLYLVVVFHGQSYWATLFDLPADSIGVRSIWLRVFLRVIGFVIVAGVILVSAFLRFRFRTLPILFVGLAAAELAFHRLYPKLGDPPGVVEPWGFTLLVTLVVVLLVQSVGLLLPRRGLT